MKDMWLDMACASVMLCDLVKTPYYGDDCEFTLSNCVCRCGHGTA